MKITGLVIFLLCVNVSSALIGALGLFQTVPSDAHVTELQENIMEGANQTYLGSGVTGGGVITQVGDFVYGLWLFIRIFFQSIVLPSIMLQNFGVPASIATWFSIPIYFIYVVAIVQMVSGRYVE